MQSLSLEGYRTRFSRQDHKTSSQTDIGIQSCRIILGFALHLAVWLAATASTEMAQEMLIWR